MCKPKYQVVENKYVQDPDSGNCFDVLTVNGKLLKRFNHKENAERYAQSLVEDDNWMANNR